MNNCNYRIYGFKRQQGYSLIKKTNSYKQAMSCTTNQEYEKILIIEHDIDTNTDKPIKLVTHNNVKKRVRK